MLLNKIEVSHFRNLISISLTPAPGLNILEGRNASGKTSFLEAIHLLALARSFRTAHLEQLIQHDEDSFTLFAQVQSNKLHRVGLQRFRDGRTESRLDGQNLRSRSELALLLPTQLITPESLSLLTGSPAERRSFIDWTMFHVEPNFHHQWNLYRKYLKQRNALLRMQQRDTLAIWSEGLVAAGIKIDAMRKSLLQRLLPHWRGYVDRLLPDMDLQISYRQGWNKEIDFGAALSRSLETDYKMRFTGCGPHRAELVIKDGNEKVSDIFSRGQLKLLLCTMKLAQIALLREEIGLSPVVLIDDLPAELDTQHRNLLLSLLQQLDSQVFVTTTSRELLDFSGWSNVKLFHVEHGEIKEVV